MTTDTETDDPTPILTKLGDLKSPLWGDERDRVVHLEGAAVAQQVQMFLTLGLAAAMPWGLGRAGIGWGAVLMVATGIGSTCYRSYVVARGVRGYTMLHAGNRTRGFVLLAIGAVYFAGYLWAQRGVAPTIGKSIVDVLTVTVGVGVGVAVGLLIASTLKRQKQDADVPDDVFPEQ